MKMLQCCHIRQLIGMKPQYDMPQIKSVNNSVLIPEISRLVDEGRPVTLTVNGRSMRPFIEHGRDKVVLVRAELVRSGDVVLADTVEKSYVLHRVIEVDNGVCVLSGDGNLDVEHCKLCNVLAKVSVVIRKRHKYDVNGLIWRAYSFLWTKLLPVRRYLLALYRISL